MDSRTTTAFSARCNRGKRPAAGDDEPGRDDEHDELAHTRHGGSVRDCAHGPHGLDERYVDENVLESGRGVALLVLVALGCDSDDGSSRAASAPTTAASTSTTSTIPPTTTTTTTAPALSGPVTAIGDSVMIYAAPALQAAIPTITIDAAESRSALPGPAILATLAAHGGLVRPSSSGSGATVA